MCDVALAEPARLRFRPLRELEEDFAQRRSRPSPQLSLRSLEELATDFTSRCQHATRPKATRSLKAPGARSKDHKGGASYGRDELLAIFACMRLPGPAAGAGLRTAPRMRAPPGLILEDSLEDPALDDGKLLARLDAHEDPALDDERLLAQLEAREDRERGADARNGETFGPHTEVWALQQQAMEDAAHEAVGYWWDVADGEPSYYAEEDIWDFRENFMGAHDHFWGCAQAFGGHLAVGETYLGLADKTRMSVGVKDREACLSSTAPTDKESDAGSRGEEVDARLAIYS